MTMDCTDARSRLNAYLDRELDLENALAVERHVASCASCRAQLEQATALQAGLRGNLHYYRAPSGLAERIRHQAGIAPRRNWRWPSMRQWLPTGVAVAATALLSWTAALQYASVSGDERIAEQVVAGHARSIVTEHLIDVASSDRHTVKPWLSAKLDFSPGVVDLANAGFPLAGGRVDYIANRAVATLVYRARQHVIDLFIWPQDKPVDAPPRESSSKGYNVVRWSDGGMAYWAVSDVSAADLQSFADAYTRAK
jgi:anti-sigma factor RsiW